MISFVPVWTKDTHLSEQRSGARVFDVLSMVLVLVCRNILYWTILLLHLWLYVDCELYKSPFAVCIPFLFYDLKSHKKEKSSKEYAFPLYYDQKCPKSVTKASVIYLSLLPVSFVSKDKTDTYRIYKICCLSHPTHSRTSTDGDRTKLA